MDLSKMLSLGLGEISGGILEIMACLPLVGLEVDILFVGFLLDWEKTHCLKDIFLSLICSNWIHIWQIKISI